MVFYELLPFIPDYKINLIAPAAIQDNDFSKFNTTLKEVLTFIKYSRDADKLEKAVNSDEGFRHLGRNEVDVLNACVNASLTMNKEEEVLDVCQAIQTLNERAAEKAANERQIEVLLQSVKNLMKNLGLSSDQAMNVLGISDSDRSSIASRL